MPARCVLRHVPKNVLLSNARSFPIRLMVRSASSRTTAAPAPGVHRNCPTEAITVEKIFEGDIEFHAEKCPGGCSTCADICPANAIYLPSAIPAADMKLDSREATIAVNKDYCILCGACVNACPGEDIIVLQRTGVRVKGTETDLFKKIKAKLFEKRTSKVKEEITGQVNIKVMEKA